MKQEIIQRDKPIILRNRCRQKPFQSFHYGTFKNKTWVFVVVSLPFPFTHSQHSFFSTLMSHVTYVPIFSASFACLSWSLIQFHSLYPFSQIPICIDTNSESQDPHMREIIGYMSFRDWITSLHMIRPSPICFLTNYLISVFLTPE